MKKFFKAIIFSILMMFTAINLTSCLGFGEEDVLQIENIFTTTLENGDIRITITYTDEDMAPTTFIIPKGAQGEIGETGNGIKDVTTTKDENGVTILTITYTDEEVEPTVIELKDGLSMTGIESEYDEETKEVTFWVNFSDGTKSDSWVIPAGKDGKDGVSIVDIYYYYEFDGSTTLTIVMSDGNEYEVFIPAPQKGNQGRGIQSIVSVPSGDSYTMIITYTDGDTEELEFARPNKWFTEGGTPANDEGIDGDLWYDWSHNVIYIKQNGTWLAVLDLMNETNQNITYSVTFDLNDTDGVNASMPSGTQLAYVIPNGQSFYSSGYSVPLPTRDGYEFVGWYTVKDPTIVNGMFTDLTTVNKDMTLYASWIEI